MTTHVIKRDGRKVIFEKEKIYNPILKAMKYGSGIVEKEIAEAICNEAEDKFCEKNVAIGEIERFVFERLVFHNQEHTARAYEGYRSVQAFKREVNTTDDAILGLVNGTNEVALNENSNKNAYVASTQRDLIAGEVSKDITRRKLLPAHIVQAHDNGLIHYHK